MEGDLGDVIEALQAYETGEQLAALERASWAHELPKPHQPRK